MEMHHSSKVDNEGSIPSWGSMDGLNSTHQLLRRARYFYYELDDTIMSDYEYDMLEKRYTEMCDRSGVGMANRVTNFVGFSDNIPMRLYYTEKEVRLEHERLGIKYKKQKKNESINEDNARVVI